MLICLEMFSSFKQPSCTYRIPPSIILKYMCHCMQWSTQKRYNTPKVEICRFSAGYTRSMTIKYMWWNQPGSSFLHRLLRTLCPNYGTNWASTVLQCRVESWKLTQWFLVEKITRLKNISHHPLTIWLQNDMIPNLPKNKSSALFPCDPYLYPTSPRPPRPPPVVL